ncbi:MAG: hypothetical protein M1818_004379 [Claussenomyces sp. TS43310]|nr:MAG: hypothetical protein M1818_004379 [Claussenomyces sp. TS43310]
MDISMSDEELMTGLTPLPVQVATRRARTNALKAATSKTGRDKAKRQRPISDPEDSDDNPRPFRSPQNIMDFAKNHQLTPTKINTMESRQPRRMRKTVSREDSSDTEDTVELTNHIGDRVPMNSNRKSDSVEVMTARKRMHSAAHEKLMQMLDSCEDDDLIAKQIELVEKLLDRLGDSTLTRHAQSNWHKGHGDDQDITAFAIDHEEKDQQPVDNGVDARQLSMQGNQRKHGRVKTIRTKQRPQKRCEQMGTKSFSALPAEPDSEQKWSRKRSETKEMSDTITKRPQIKINSEDEDCRGKNGRVGRPKKTRVGGKKLREVDEITLKTAFPANQPRAQLPDSLRRQRNPEVDDILKESKVHSTFDTAVHSLLNRHERKINSTNRPAKPSSPPSRTLADRLQMFERPSPPLPLDGTSSQAYSDEWPMPDLGTATRNGQSIEDTWDEYADEEAFGLKARTSN